jgi:hypothetical protein
MAGVRLTHHFNRQPPHESIYKLAEGEQTLMETGSVVKMFREVRRRKLAAPNEMLGAQTCQYAVDLRTAKPEGEKD